MKHLGDITKISGREAPPVKVIIGGSPCQDLSVAGKRAGLAGERSGLFMEQIRIIKEMREKDERNGRKGTDVRPRFMVWENVPGAFSSNKGADFAAVLQETVKVVEQKAPDIPVPDKGWPTAGALRDVDGRWSVAWRVLDAQYWGVPQRRRRIALVADFGGASAPTVLFECQSLLGDSAESGEERESIATDAQRSTGADDSEGDSGVICLQGNGIDRADTAGCNGKGWNDQTCYTLNTIDRPAVAYSFDSLASNSMKSSNPNSGCREVTVAKTLDTTDPNPSKNQGGMAIVQAAGFCPEQSAKTRGIGYEDEEAPTLRAGATPAVAYLMRMRDGCEGGGKGPLIQTEKNGTLATRNDQYLFEPKSLLDENWSEADTKNALRAEASKSSHAVVQELYDARGNGDGNTAPTITGDHENRVTDYTAVVVESPVLMDAYQHHGWREGETCGTLTAGQNDSIRGDTPVIVGFREGSFGGYVEGEVGTLKASGGCLAGGSETLAVQTKPQYIVRRLTPLECERLQGFPDGWTDIGEWTDSSGKRKQTTDSARYKALGNSIAIPPWTFVLSNLILWCGADVTMASLFDGIGGFPLIWNRLGGETLWASEIEEFPIAVTKLHFQEETR